MRTRRMIIVALTMVLSAGLSAVAQVPVVQLDPAHFSTQELTTIADQLEQLDELLRRPTLGPQRRLGQDGWTEASFARFTAGSLAERGYPVYLAAGGGHDWVLAGLSVDGRTVWVPVDAAPAAGAVQQTLGRVPYTDAGSIRIESRYLAPSSASALPSNRAPTAALRASETTIQDTDTLRLIASQSSDADGRVVLYRWCVDGSPCAATTSWSYVAHPNATGDVRIVLTVVDDGGFSASTTMSIVVLETVDVPDPPAGCGCGG